MWDAETGSELVKMSAHAGLRTAAFSLDGRRVVTASDDQQAQVWDPKTGALLLTLAGHEPGNLTRYDKSQIKASFSPDGTSVLTASHDSTVRVWDIANGTATKLLTGHAGMVVDATFDPKGERVVTASLDDYAAIWDA